MAYDETSSLWERWHPEHERGRSDQSYDRGFRGSSRYDRPFRDRPRDEWWIGNRPGTYEPREYDARYRNFDRLNRPRFSPIGGNYHAMGGSYMYRRPPRPLRYDTWFSDHTRWF